MPLGIYFYGIRTCVWNIAIYIGERFWKLQIVFESIYLLTCLDFDVHNWLFDLYELIIQKHLRDIIYFVDIHIYLSFRFDTFQ